jgi:polyhydroxybutyrate depolymerase
MPHNAGMKRGGRLFMVCLWAFLPVPLPAQPAPPTCDTVTPCEVEGGFYHARLPAGWDGRPKLPVLIHFHGWQDEAKMVITEPGLMAFADRRDVILIVPQGAGKTWSYPGSPGTHRDEFAFTRAVLADVKARFPVDEAQVFASGFSQGGSMVWNLACHQPEGFTGFIPVSGGFWEPLPESCKPGPRRIFHIHGTGDRTVPLAGRSLRNGTYKQGDIRKGWAVLQQAMACSGPAVAIARETRFACEHMKGCPGSAAMELCLHGGGHDMDPTFLDLGLDWMGTH